MATIYRNGRLAKIVNNSSLSEFSYRLFITPNSFEHRPKFGALKNALWRFSLPGRSELLHFGVGFEQRSLISSAEEIDELVPRLSRVTDERKVEGEK